MTIDAHHHFWHYRADEFGWIDESMSAIARDFGPPELSAAIQTAGVDGVISVQARQTTEETSWLLELAGANDFVRGVVGWVPLCSPDVDDELVKYATHTKLRGVRHVVHDEPDDDFILGDAFNYGVSRLVDYDLAYDILIFEKHLPQTIEFVDRHPQTRFIVDHVAKPQIGAARMEPWRTTISRLAKREQVYCKVSGMVTEADWRQWTPDALKPYFETVLEAFGPERLMFGSDWPVCLLACDYAKWVTVVREWASKLSPAEQQRLFAGTAIEAYQLGE